MAECGCTPGTSENGWHEMRSQACLDKELESWRRLIDAAVWRGVAKGLMRSGEHRG